MSVTVSQAAPTVTLQLGAGSTIEAQIEASTVTVSSGATTVTIAANIGLTGQTGATGATGTAGDGISTDPTLPIVLREDFIGGSTE